MRKLLSSFPDVIIIVLMSLTTIISWNTLGVQEALAAVGQNNSTNLTSKTPTDAVTVIKQGEQSVSAQLDQAREAMQSDNTSQAIQYIEQAQQQLETLAICATSVLNTTAATK